MDTPPLRWRIVSYRFRRVVVKAAKRVLVDRSLVDAEGRQIRWLEREIEKFIADMKADVDTLRPVAGLENLPSFGNQLMVEATIYTVSADRVLRKLGVEPNVAAQIVSDLGWGIYRRLLLPSTSVIGLITRDPGRRLRWTIRMLLWFPFNAPGAPGYEVRIIRQGDDILTRFTHCPPQSFARRLSEETNDPRVLEVFRRSWCTYDWPGADIIAGDGDRGHYTRPVTLSKGDPACDMCWRAKAFRD
ncbi:hypothetical protein SAMN04488527_11276 [Aliiroseovarius crassostreae]|uniref:L-2-amino-thiazoline-4-carboxylic acid hydrolase n=1 Tax=Aliiroseovarius crassostreae TaxID=154981 RepID=A0A0P7I1S0_9RHOB|nr:hypothetical protein [Aliiroseovarius crassostreae]KPN62855.1 hypothetical protein AKJ29_01600 [Aliiroseovarius crassostreae]SFU72105.1 hypothetical protein SAMN04488527_11276 [Aliiroseovarius crassostreae]